MWEMYDNACNVKRSHNCWFGRQQSDMTNVTAAILSLRLYVCIHVAHW